MSADEVLGDGSVLPDRSGGARHAAPKKPLFTRLHMPAGKAIAMAAMPTAVLMGMGFTPTLAVADDQPTSNSQLADDYKDCLTALESASASPSASPSPSASEGDSKSDAKDKDSKGDASDSGSEKSGGAKNPSSSKGSKGSSSGGSSSSDSGSDEGPAPAPAPSASASAQEPSSGGTETESPAPAETEKTDKNVLETIGDAVKDVFDGGGLGGSATTDDASPSPSASPSATDSGAKSGASGSSAGTGKSSGTAAEDTSDAVTDTAKDTTQTAGDKAGETAEQAGEKTDEAASDAKDAADASPSPSASASPSPSASSTVKPEDCAAATDKESGVDNKVLLADDPWYLNASALLLKSADYQGIVEVKTANGTKKKVLKYVISGGTEIDDLHQTVDDKQKGVTYHVQAGAGTKSKITGGDTIMYTESISGNLFGLLPVTFSPQNPPPLNIPLIYFTKVKVVQAGQFGGNLHIPGMQVYTSKLAG
ncbi:hypothetical protein [Streptomyces sp. NPDC088254]|uniref:hypothetical protein n=1 Tax=Streptomyces sp. NPDC088254 TaxID=3365847 RepID=UPI0037FB0765